MNYITRHLPGYVEADAEPKPEAFTTKEELLNIPFVRYFSTLPNFYKYSVSTDLLMAEYEEGKRGNVVGHLELNEPLDLPKWSMPSIPFAALPGNYYLKPNSPVKTPPKET